MPLAAVTSPPRRRLAREDQLDPLRSGGHLLDLGLGVAGHLRPDGVGAGAQPIDGELPVVIGEGLLGGEAPAPRTAIFLQPGPDLGAANGLPLGTHHHPADAHRAGHHQIDLRLLLLLGQGHGLLIGALGPAPAHAGPVAGDHRDRSRREPRQLEAPLRIGRLHPLAAGATPPGHGAHLGPHRRPTVVEPDRPRDAGPWLQLQREDLLLALGERLLLLAGDARLLVLRGHVQLPGRQAVELEFPGGVGADHLERPPQRPVFRDHPHVDRDLVERAAVAGQHLSGQSGTAAQLESSDRPCPSPAGESR